MISEKAQFHTFNGNISAKDSQLTPSMEDYLEMIYRILRTEKVVRIHKLAENLNVKASSASKMVAGLTNLGYLYYEKYGYVCLSDDGIEMGEYLLKRHSVLNRLLCYINKSDDELEQVEKIEHFFNRKTVENINVLLNQLEGNSSEPSENK